MLGFPRAGYIHVFLIRSSARERIGPRLGGLLLAERRASRAYIDVHARIEFIVSRICLRFLASKYLGVKECEISVRKNTLGQPRLVNTQCARAYPLHVSLSHSARGVAIVFARKARVGVDFETHRAPPLGVTRLLSGAEQVLATPHEIWNCWTRKEALLKAMGLGLSGLASVPTLERESQLVCAGGSQWTVASISVAPDCSLAVAAEGPRPFFRISTFRSCSTLRRSF